MQTVTIDIINDKAVNLLRDLELLQLIRLRKEKPKKSSATKNAITYKGAMQKQSLSDIDRQLNDLRTAWE